MSWFRPRTISAEARKRGIRRLLHSTHLYKNLPQILETGRLETVRDLNARYGEAQAARFVHDPRRYEQFAVGLDYLNAALSHPNVELLYHRSKSEWKGDWVHLALNIKLLDCDDTMFCPVSAAADFGQHVQGGLDGFRLLFAAQVEKYTRENLPKNVPTHPQAEVLIHGSLPLAEADSIIVPSESAALEVRRLADLHHRTTRIEILPQLFVWPKWLIDR